MFFSKWFLKKKVETPAEILLEQIQEILFPAPDKRKEDGIEWYLDSSVDSNLYAAMIDMDDGKTDVITRDTIKKCHDKLYEVRKLLNKFHELDTNSKYVLVDIEEK